MTLGNIYYLNNFDKHNLGKRLLQVFHAIPAARLKIFTAKLFVFYDDFVYLLSI
jgi:hypothetical protein